jgi:hypothetical protein
MHKYLLIAPMLCLAVSSSVAQKVAKLTEELRLDATAEDFPTVNRVLVGPRGRIGVVLARDNQVRIYDSTGKKLGVVGRTGSGPGEFRGMSAIGWIRDTLYVADRSLRRTSFFGPDLKLLRTTPWIQQSMTGYTPSSDDFRNGFFFNPIVLYPEGGAFGDANLPVRSASRDDPWEYFFAMQAPDGSVKKIAASPNREDPRWSMAVAGFGNSVPFVASPNLGYAQDGSRYGFILVDNIERDGGVITVRSYRRDGTLEFERKIPFKGEPIPAHVRDSALASFLPRPGEPTEGPPDLGKRFQDIARSRMPSFYPPVSGLLFGMDGTTWIRLRMKNDVQSAQVLDARGNLIGVVNPPKRTFIHRATRTHIWVTERDEDDLVSVVRYRIDWPK